MVNPIDIWIATAANGGSDSHSGEYGSPVEHLTYALNTLCTQDLGTRHRIRSKNVGPASGTVGGAPDKIDLGNITGTPLVVPENVEIWGNGYDLKVPEFVTVITAPIPPAPCCPFQVGPSSATWR